MNPSIGTLSTCKLLDAIIISELLLFEIMWSVSPTTYLPWKRQSWQHWFLLIILKKPLLGKRWRNIMTDDGKWYVGKYIKTFGFQRNIKSSQEEREKKNKIELVGNRASIYRYRYRKPVLSSIPNTGIKFGRIPVFWGPKMGLFWLL